MNPDNACILRITAAAGTELADAYSRGTCKAPHVERFIPAQRSLQPVGPSSSTLLGWFRLSPIDQYSSLLPPVGVWAVSQSQCGGLPLRTPIHRRHGGPLPRRQANGTHPHPFPDRSFGPHPCGPGTPPGINPAFAGLTPGKGKVGYALLTRAPVAAVPDRNPARDAPRLACVRPVASVHPEPGSNSTLYNTIDLLFPRSSAVLPNAEAKLQPHYPCCLSSQFQ